MSVEINLRYVHVPIRHESKDGPRYERVPIKHRLPDGSWRLPRHIVHCLGTDPATGRFDPNQAGDIVEHLFPTATLIEHGEPGRPDVLIPARTVAALGHGDLALGHEILERWHDQIAADAFSQAWHRALRAPL